MNGTIGPSRLAKARLIADDLVQVQLSMASDLADERAMKQRRLELETALETARAVEIDADAPVLLEGASALAEAGVRTGASVRNWAAYGGAVRLDAELLEWRRDKFRRALGAPASLAA